MLLLTLQTLHTAIAIWNIGCLLYMNYSHATGRTDKKLLVAYFTIAVESLAIIPFGFVCPLRLLVDRWYSPAVNDTLIPTFISTWIMPVGIFLFITSILAKPVRFLYHE
jgi:hypothetical protein